MAVRPRRRCATRRQVGLEGRRVVPRAGPEGRHRRQRRRAGCAHRGRQRTGAAGRRPTASRRPTWTDCSRVYSSISCRSCSTRGRLRRRRRRGAGAGDRYGRRTASAGSRSISAPTRSPRRSAGAPRRRLADVVATAAKVDRVRRRCSDDHSRRTRVPRSRCQRILGAGGRRRRGCRAICACSSTRGSASGSVRQISFRFAADDDQFMTIAKFRAARQLWARVAEVFGAPDAGAAHMHAVTSTPMMTQRDPWVNMLRTTLAAFGAGVGAPTPCWCSRSTPRSPVDYRAPHEFRRAESPATRNCCCWRSPTSARCSTPAAAHGSSRSSPTSSPRQAWAFFQEIEPRAVSLEAARLSWPPRSPRCATERSRRHRAPPDRDHRRQRIPEPREAAAAPNRDSSERGRALRRGFRSAARPSDAYLANNGSRPKVLLLPLGPLAEHNVRTTFAANLLASGGIEAVNPGTSDAAGMAEAVSDAAAPRSRSCAAPTPDTLRGADAVEAARAAGVSGSAWRDRRNRSPMPGANPDVFLTAKIDAVAALSDLLTRLGA